VAAPKTMRDWSRHRATRQEHR